MLAPSVKACDNGKTADVGRWCIEWATLDQVFTVIKGNQKRCMLEFIMG